ncbi:HNH endonuclease signature motif containing protein [Jiangella muralis]|uniref:HNH endonuclease signature motif containing protein n=1 Tax=Jiangella muralis TaxID=702383 RepID=UPI0009FAEFF0|nr:HNH endonuclease signature motif containing protein [Jiangella muralis]
MTQRGWAGRRVTRARAAIRRRGQVQPCTRCGRAIDLDREAWHVDHIVELALGGAKDDPANHGPAHPRCNTAAGGKLGGQLAAARRRAPTQRTERTRRW